MPENQGATGVTPGPSLKIQEPRTLMSERRRRWMSQLKQKVNLLFLCCFALFRPSMNWMMSMNIGIGDLYSAY